MQPAADESGVVGLNEDAHRDAVNEARAHRQRIHEADKAARAKANGHLSVSSAAAPGTQMANGGPAKLTPHNLRMLLRAKQEGAEAVERDETGNADPAANEVIMVSSFKAPPGKRVSGKVRVEPKVYFANERTYLVSSALLAVDQL
jgi:hypothetical protein